MVRKNNSSVTQLSGHVAASNLKSGNYTLIRGRHMVSLGPMRLQDVGKVVGGYNLVI